MGGDSAAEDLWLPEPADGTLRVVDAEDRLCVCELPGVWGLAEAWAG